MKTVQLGTITVGAGMPKVAAPIVGKTADEIIASARQIASAACDIAELRADYYERVTERDTLLLTLERVRDALDTKPLIFTFRSAGEGGMAQISAEDYASLAIAAAESGLVDAVDLEIFTGDALVRQCVSAIHAAGRVVIGSSHDFQKTPPKNVLIGWMRKAQEMDADIAKIAVMPQNRADVLTLLAAAEEMTRLYADRPIAAMSMSALGVASRLCGESFGSSITFGTVARASAPGQPPVDALNTALRILHDAEKGANV